MQDEEIPFGYVYRIMNKINGKTYVGQRKLCRDISWRQYMGSGKLVIQAITKYGEENFVKSLIHYAYSREELDRLESISILKENDIGHSEYNLRVFVPNPESWLNSSPARLEEIKRKHSVYFKKWLESNDNPSHTASVKRYKIFCEKHSDDVIRLYGEIKSVEKVAKLLGTSKKYCNRLLKERNVQLNHRNIVGVEHSSETLQKISKSVISRNLEKIDKQCLTCFTAISTKSLDFCTECMKARKSEKLALQKALKESKAKIQEIDKYASYIPEIISLYKEKLSIREISRSVGLDRKIVHRILVENNLSIPKQDNVKAIEAIKASKINPDSKLSA